MIPVSFLLGCLISLQITTQPMVVICRVNHNSDQGLKAYSLRDICPPAGASATGHRMSWLLPILLVRISLLKDYVSVNKNYK